jgi:hypothetical protein
LCSLWLDCEYNPLTACRELQGRRKVAFALFALSDFSSRMRAIVYIDGFNLYYCMLKGAPAYKWLNLDEGEAAE